MGAKLYRDSAVNASKYNTGKPCKRGHYADRYATSKGCVECTRLRRLAQWEQEKGKAKVVEKEPKNRQVIIDNVRAIRRTYVGMDRARPHEKPDIAGDVARFLAQGGAITQLPAGAARGGEWECE